MVSLDLIPGLGQVGLVKARLDRTELNSTEESSIELS